MIQNYHFVISSPRSGSTWLARALNQHPEILATENRLFGMFCEVWKNNNGKSAPRITADQFVRGLANHSFFGELGFESAKQMDNELFPALTKTLAEFLRQRSGKPVIVDKVTPYLGTSRQVLEKAACQFTDAKFVHLIRDGHDVAVSGVFDWVAREKEDSDRYKFFVQQDRTIELNRFFDDELLERWATYWKEPHAAFSELHNQFPPERVVEVRYESMLQDQGLELQRIFTHLQVAGDAKVAESCAAAVTFEKTTQRSAGQADNLAKARKGIAGDWKRFFTRTDARQFQQLTGDLLQRLGYEKDDSWIDACPETLVATDAD